MSEYIKQTSDVPYIVHLQRLVDVSILTVGDSPHTSSGRVVGHENKTKTNKH